MNVSSTEKLLQGWQEIKLNELFVFEKKSGRKAGEGKEQGMYKFFTSSSEQKRVIDTFDYEGEHLIFATGGQAGIHYCNEKFSASNDCFVVKVKEALLAKYLYYYLFSKLYLLEQGFRGAGLKHISKSYINKIKIYYPENKNIQKRIVSILEKAEKLKEWRKEADEFTKDFLKSVFLEMFFKKYKTVGVRSYIKKIIDYRGKTPPFSNSGIRCISAANIDKGTLKFDIEKRVSIEYHRSNLQRGIIEPNDIIITTEAPVGEVALLSSEEEFRLTRRVMALRIDSGKANSHYVLHFFLSNHFKHQLIKFLRGSTVPRILKPDLLNIQIPDAPIELQNKFASIVKEVELLKEQQKQSKKQLDNLFNSLIQKAFRGELVK